MPRAPITPSKLAAPAGAFGALAVAVGVWVIPGSALDPTPPQPPAPKPLPGNAPAILTPPEPPQVDWAALARNLDRLRAPDPVVTESEATGQLLTPDQPLDEPPPPMTLASWQYEGHVQEADRIIALVRIAAVQRFVFVDQEIKDPSIPGSGLAVIRSIDPERIMVEVNGREFEVKRSVPTNQNTLMGDQRPQAGRVD
jgi:hypothetical protein